MNLNDAWHDEWHPAVWDDPESIWDRIREYLCRPIVTGDTPSRAAQDDWLTRIDLIEDLMFRHSDAFIDRIEALAVECPDTREAIAWAYVDGRAVDEGLERFWALQNRLRATFELHGDGQ